MKILVDTNILLDVAQQREPHRAASDEVLKWCEAHPRHGCAAWHSVSNVYYLLERQIGDAQPRQFITALLEVFEVAATGTALAKHALRLPIADFEDALQCAAGIAAGVEVIITRNQRDYTGSPIPTQTPGEFLASLPT